MLLVYKGDTRCTMGQWYEQGTQQAQFEVQEILFRYGDVLRFHLVQDHDLDCQFLVWVEALSAAASTTPSDTGTGGAKFVDMVYGVSQSVYVTMLFLLS